MQVTCLELFNRTRNCNSNSANGIAGGIAF